MAMRIPVVMSKALKDNGLVPDHCMNIELLMPANGIMMLRYEIAVEPADLAKLAESFATMSDAQDKVA